MMLLVSLFTNQRTLQLIVLLQSTMAVAVLDLKIRIIAIFIISFHLIMAIQLIKPNLIIQIFLLMEKTA